MPADESPAASPRPTAPRSPRVMLSCGEASGDLYATALVGALREIDPGIDAFGFGGDRLAAAGVPLIGHYRGVSVTGLSEALSALPRSWSLLRTLTAAARDRRPDVFVAIDFPDFNFRLLPAMRRLGVPVVYYVSPQLWAWRPGRLRTIQRFVDRMVVIFPFEEALYERAGVPVEFVGHPLLDVTRVARPREVLLRDAGLRADRPVVALLPGSRASELRHILPTMAGGAVRLASAVDGVQFLVARAPTLDDRLFAPLSALTSAGVPVATVANDADSVLAAADVVVTASGTATVQAAIHGRPMVVVYRLSPLTYAIGRSVVKVDHYCMVNLIAGARVVPELVQEGFTAETVAREAGALLTDPVRRAAMIDALAGVRARLGEPGASARAARAVIDVARTRRR